MTSTSNIPTFEGIPLSIFRPPEEFRAAMELRAAALRAPTGTTERRILLVNAIDALKAFNGFGGSRKAAETCETALHAEFGPGPWTHEPTPPAVMDLITKNRERRAAEDALYSSTGQVPNSNLVVRRWIWC
jgi:hypothetical protein